MRNMPKPQENRSEESSVCVASAGPSTVITCSFVMRIPLTAFTVTVPGGTLARTKNFWN